MQIEQAVFTSLQTDSALGYQLVGRSPGIDEAVAREIALWAPSHDSLWNSHRGVSINFARLASGWYAVSRTTLAGAEYSGRGGDNVYTQFLIVPPEVLEQFGNNPFALLRAATAGGSVGVHEQVPETLEPLHLIGGAPAVDQSLVARLARDPGPAALATLVQAALASDRLAVSANVEAESLIAGLISLLPMECRPEFSFSTGLKSSSSRVVRLSSLPPDRASWSAIARQGYTVLDLKGASSENIVWRGWAGYVSEILTTGKLSALARALNGLRPCLSCDKLDELGEQLRARFAAAPTHDSTTDTPAEIQEFEASRQRADAPHAMFHNSSMGITTRDSVPFAANEKSPPAEQTLEVLELLERIDDLVFMAIDGDKQSLAQLESLWPTVLGQLNRDSIEESREQYLRCTLSRWTSSCADDHDRHQRAVAAIDVLSILFDD